MSELWQSVMADNGAYFLSAYATVFGAFIGYTLWLKARLATLAQQGGREQPPAD